MQVSDNNKKITVRGAAAPPFVRLLFIFSANRSYNMINEYSTRNKDTR